MSFRQQEQKMAKPFPDISSVDSNEFLSFQKEYLIGVYTGHNNPICISNFGKWPSPKGQIGMSGELHLAPECDIPNPCKRGIVHRASLLLLNTIALPHSDS